jgi:hypothetical protein
MAGFQGTEIWGCTPKLGGSIGFFVPLSSGALELFTQGILADFHEVIEP